MLTSTYYADFWRRQVYAARVLRDSAVSAILKLFHASYATRRVRRLLTPAAYFTAKMIAVYSDGH